MAETILLPKRPDSDKDFGTTIKASDKDLLVYTCAFSIPNQTAYARWHPEFCDSSGKLTDLGRKQCSMFFNYGKHRDYMEAYKATLAKVVGGNKEEVAVLDIDDTRKDKALKSLLNQAMSLVESGSDLDADSLKTISEIFKKIGLLKDEVEQVESPRRYLPERCNSCSYRSFVESYVETGQIENSCLRCKALDIAKEHGFLYDPKNLLREKEETTEKSDTDEKQ